MIFAPASDMMTPEPRGRWWRRRSILRLGVFLHDSIWIVLSIPLSLAIDMEWHQLVHMMTENRWLLYIEIAFLCQSASLFWFRCYRGIWRFASLPDLIRLAEAVFVGTLLTFGVTAFIGNLAGKFHDLLMEPVILLAGLGTGRILYRIWKERRGLFSQQLGQRAILIGTGVATELLFRDLRDDRTYVPVGFVDDDPFKQGQYLHGVPVLGTVNALARVIHESRAQMVIYAMPSASRRTLQQVVQVCQEARVPCRILPRLSELVNQRVTIDRLRPVSVEDLLGREPVITHVSHLQAYFGEKRVLITGAGGSIGAEICRQMLALGVGHLILVDHAEYNLYRILSELETHVGARIEGHLVNVCSRVEMGRLFQDCRPDIVFHAAAYKHVNLVEKNPVQGIRNNVFGTEVVAELSMHYSVKRFVLVSTDKAVWPTNVMGATKRLAERIALGLDKMGGTEFVSVRFGNVLDSIGSVVPLFRAQIQAGGPVTVTHPDVKRYFMTIREAVHLVLEAGASDLGGGVFVLDMGEPIRIRDLAKQMIELSGNRVGEDIEIVYIGLRPGEKLAEQLFYEHERPQVTSHPKLILAHSGIPTDWFVMKRELGDWSQRLEASSRAEIREDLVRYTQGEFRAMDMTGSGGEPDGRGDVRSLVLVRSVSEKKH